MYYIQEGVRGRWIPSPARGAWGLCYMMRLFFGLPRLVEDDLCPLPSSLVGPGHGVRDWSKSPWSKLGIPVLRRDGPGFVTGQSKLWSRFGAWTLGPFTDT